MIINSSVKSFSLLIGALGLASCAGNLSPTTADELEGIVKYPGSALIYNICHERWLRNGYKYYSFQAETGVYDPFLDTQKGVLSTINVMNGELSSISACDLEYSGQSRQCRPSTQRAVNVGNTIDDHFTLWKKNPGLYQSCHPVLGYPTGYGKTYGAGGRRIDASSWLILSGVIPVNRNSHAPTISSSKTNPQLKQKNSVSHFASINELHIKLHDSRVDKVGNQHHLNSSFSISNPTAKPAKLSIQGWMIDKDYQRYPLYVADGHKKQGKIFSHVIPPHTKTIISYIAEGAPNISLGRRTAALLEIESADKVKVNLSLPNQ